VQSYPRLGVKIPSLHLLILKFFLLLCVQIEEEEEEEEEEETSEMIAPIPKEDTNPPPSLIPVNLDFEYQLSPVPQMIIKVPVSLLVINSTSTTKH
jgi:hypothetical protein